MELIKAMKTSKIIIGLIVLAILVVIGLFLFEDNQPLKRTSTTDGPVPIVLSMDIDAERAFDAQVFWTEDEFDNFNKKQSVRKKVEAGQSHFSLTIPTDIIHKLRFDFGSKPGTVVVSNIHLTGQDPVDLDVSKFNTFSPDVDTHHVHKGQLTVTSEGPDPYMVYKYPVDVVTD